MDTTGTDYSGTLSSPWQGARKRGEHGQLAPYDSFSIFRPGTEVSLQAHRHRLPEHLQVRAYPILGGLHHDYRLEEKAA